MVDRITAHIMKETMNGCMDIDDAGKYLADPEGFKFSKKFPKGVTYRCWKGAYKSPRMTVAYCWSCHKNIAGYYLGWRQIYGPDGKIIEKDQWIARRVKKRLAEVQTKKTEAMIEKGYKKVRVKWW